ncbi:DUF2178 domain-containing protein [Halobacillus hunanensis]|uniref:DUF2178 domain-containing protein n=1 Tax=Halobacillus hunanensis TaxID=578214 RepID=UPI001116C684|nr:DUF2178 domain-containing protein [Halobacillus hunanensis]
MTFESMPVISNSIFYPLKIWAEKSNDNWNMLIVSGFILLLVGGVLILVYRNKMGKSDERTSHIYLKSAFVMLGGVVLCDLIFPKGYMWQIFFLFKYSLAFFASGIYLAVQYKRDFLN